MCIKEVGDGMQEQQITLNFGKANWWNSLFNRQTFQNMSFPELFSYQGPNNAEQLREKSLTSYMVHSLQTF